jgi:hypothetical protein
MPRQKAPEAIPAQNIIEINQYQLSDSAELTSSATVKFMHGGMDRYVKTELKEIPLDGEDFEDTSYRCVEIVRVHLLRLVAEITDHENDINRSTRSTR